MCYFLVFKRCLKEFLNLTLHPTTAPSNSILVLPKNEHHQHFLFIFPMLKKKILIQYLKNPSISEDRINIFHHNI